MHAGVSRSDGTVVIGRDDQDEIAMALFAAMRQEYGLL
jgi:hypothetical protein